MCIRDRWKRALADYRVLLLDQRGTGRSTPVTHRSLLRRGDAQAQASYLRHFRADSIIRDAELIRHELTGDQPWSVFCLLYTSLRSGIISMHSICCNRSNGIRSNNCLLASLLFLWVDVYKRQHLVGPMPGTMGNADSLKQLTNTLMAFLGLDITQ